MIISHLPTGYITARVLEKKYWKEFSRKQVLWLYAVLLFFSIAPDFDLAYFWFINGMNSHREFFTHSLVFYLFLGLGVYVGMKYKKTLLYRGEIKKEKGSLRSFLFFLGKSKNSVEMTKPACEKVSEQKKCSLDNFAIWVSLCVVIGAVAHLMLDSILSCVEWLWPIYKNPIGLPNINGYFNIIKSNCFPIFIAIELVVSVIAFYMLIYANWKAKNRGYILNSQIMTKMAKFDYFYSPVCAGRLRNSLRSNSPACAGMPRSKNSKFSNFRQHKYAQLCMMNLFMISLVAIAIILPFAMRNNFYMAPDIGNRDFDRDGIKNDKDFDYDNDGIENFYDADANGNGLNNRDEFITQAKEMAGVYSRKGNNFLGRILGIGMISDATMLRVSLENLGIFLSEEMNRDFFKFQEKYKEEVYNYEFSYNAENIYIFFKNKKMLIYDHCDAKQIEEIEKGDVVFYGDNYGHLAIVVDVSSTNYSVIEAGSYYEKVVILNKEEMEKIYGKPQAIVRLF